MSGSASPGGLPAERIRRVASAVRRAVGEESVAGAAILGSGFGALVDAGTGVSYADLGGFPGCGVAGHAGRVVAVGDRGRIVLVFSGRIHPYEVEHPDDSIFAVDLAKALGARRLLLTCAAGGLRDELAAGSLVVIEDHLNLSGWTPCIAPHDFLDLGQVYDSGWRSCLTDSARRHGLALPSAVLACVRGPAYETPAEVRMLQTLGADLVCMSTVPEAIRAQALDMEVAALAVIANPAAGLSSSALRHADVLDRVGLTVARHEPFLQAAVASAAGEKIDRVP